jgi:hypothetical protein
MEVVRILVGMKGFFTLSHNHILSRPPKLRGFFGGPVGYSQRLFP